MSETPPEQPSIPTDPQTAATAQDQTERFLAERTKIYAQVTAVTLGTLALIGAGLDSATDMLPYADPQQWIVAGLVLIGIGAGQKIPSLISGK